MKLILDLSPETAVGLRRLANENKLDLEAAAAIALREFLIIGGWLEVFDIDEQTPTEGNA